MFNYIHWNPKRELFVIPYLNFPILWYSILFLIGFVVGYYIFIAILKRYFFLFPNLTDKDVISSENLKRELLHPNNVDQEKVSNNISIKKNFSLVSILDRLNQFISGNVKNRLFLEKLYFSSILSTRKKLIKITDRLIVYVVLATVIGARLGHLIFYEPLSYYLKNPLNIFKLWQGGLASHGAAIAILIALIFFCYYLRRFSPKLTYIHLLDFVCPPIAFAGFCIRIGNFFNQEIIGIPTTVPWAVVFMSSFEGLDVLPRHPVQLYESFFYLAVFFLLFFLSYKKYFLVKEGKLFSLFLILVFTFRFFIEFFKVRQSNILDGEAFLLMGQYLSIPFIITGIFFLFWDKTKSFFLKNNKIID